MLPYIAYMDPMGNIINHILSFSLQDPGLRPAAAHSSRHLPPGWLPATLKSPAGSRSKPSFFAMEHEGFQAGFNQQI